MIELNLLPPEVKKIKKKKVEIDIPVIPICISFAAFLLLVHLVLVFLGRLVSDDGFLL